MEIAKSNIQPAKPPIIVQFALEHSLYRWSMNFVLGFFGLLCTLVIVTGAKRVLAAQWLNTDGALFDSQIDLYQAVEQHFAISLMVLLLWSVGLFFSAYLAGLKVAKSKTMVFCLAANRIGG